MSGRQRISSALTRSGRRRAGTRVAGALSLALSLALSWACSPTHVTRGGADTDALLPVAGFDLPPSVPQSLARQSLAQYWLALQHLTRKALYEQMARANERTDWLELAWLQLAIIARYYDHGIAAQIHQRDAWLTRWPNHPMASRMPAELARLDHALVREPRHIALLLPLDGNSATAGRAVRDGFLAAYYSTRHSEGHAPPTVDIIDTAGRAMRDLVPKLQSAGVDMVIGPLRKSAVQALCDIEEPLSFAVLALNRTQHCAAASRITRYGLSVDDEVDQLARTLAWQGARRMMVLAHKRPWTQRAQDRFGNRWNALGGEVIPGVQYATQRELPGLMTQAMHLRDSERRHANAERLLGESLAFSPRRRKDIDGILLLASPKEMRISRPIVNFYYGSDIPVYSVSRMHAGDETAQRYQDILGVTLTEAPWIIDRFDLRDEMIDQIGAQDGASTRLLGLGVDAYWLATRLSMWEINADYALYGAHGWLHLSPEGVVRRNLLWARVVEGGLVAERPRRLAGRPALAPRPPSAEQRQRNVQKTRGVPAGS